MVRISRQNRVSIDLDTKNYFTLLKTYYNAKRFSDYVDVYETKKGYHVLMDIPDRTPELNLHIRRMLYDDPMRLWLDEFRLSLGLGDYIEVLFMEKRIIDGKKITISGEIPLDPLAPPFWEVRNH